MYIVSLSIYISIYIYIYIYMYICVCIYVCPPLLVLLGEPLEVVELDAALPRYAGEALRLRLLLFHDRIVIRLIIRIIIIITIYDNKKKKKKKKSYTYNFLARAAPPIALDGRPALPEMLPRQASTLPRLRPSCFLRARLVSARFCICVRTSVGTIINRHRCQK